MVESGFVPDVNKLVILLEEGNVEVTVKEGKEDKENKVWVLLHRYFVMERR